MEQGNARILQSGAQRFTRVLVTDDPGAGNACHHYRINSVSQDGTDTEKTFGEIAFQNGPIKENGVNGIHNEDLLVIVIDRLEGFQSGEYACKENAVALKLITETLIALNERTQKRQDRGVEGTSTV